MANAFSHEAFNSRAFESQSDFTLTAAVGALALTGKAAGLAAQRYLHAAPAPGFTLVGNTTALRADRKLVAAVGGIVLSGIAAGLRAARFLHVAPTEFIMAGKAAMLRFGFSLPAAHTTFSLTGEAARLLESTYFYSDVELILVPWEQQSISVSEEDRVMIVLADPEPLADLDLTEDRTLVALPRRRA